MSEMYLSSNFEKDMKKLSLIHPLLNTLQKENALEKRKFLIEHNKSFQFQYDSLQGLIKKKTGEGEFLDERVKRECHVLERLLHDTNLFLAGRKPQASKSLFEAESNAKLSFSLIVLLRSLHEKLNWWRLEILREKRLDCSVQPFIHGKAGEQLNHLCQYTFQPVNVLYSFLAFLFYIPIFFSELFLLAKHAYPGSWMSDEEKSLGWRCRVAVRLRYSGFRLVNAFDWMLTGILTFKPIFDQIFSHVCHSSIVITVLLYAKDVLNLAVKCWFDYWDYRKQLKSFEEKKELYEEEKQLELYDLKLEGYTKVFQEKKQKCV